MNAKNQHEWSYLPELGQNWSWCSLCSRARKLDDPAYYTYNQALDEVGKENNLNEHEKYIYNLVMERKSAAAALGRSRSPRKAASSRENGRKGGRVTQAVVDRWLLAWRPDLASFEDQWGNKGIYRKSYGPAADFSAEGKTWKQVLDFLKGDED